MTLLGHGNPNYGEGVLPADLERATANGWTPGRPIHAYLAKTGNVEADFCQAKLLGQRQCVRLAGHAGPHCSGGVEWTEQMVGRGPEGVAVTHGRAKARQRTLPKLDVGCGPYRRDEDYITVDQFFDGSDVKANAWELPFNDGSIDTVWCSHMLEHVAPHQVVASLRDFYRVLRPGGRVIVSVPNFDYVARYWLTGPDRNWAQQLIYGQQFHEGEFHKTAFYPEILAGTLEGVGFKEVRVEHRWSHNQDTLQGSAIRPLP